MQTDSEIYRRIEPLIQRQISASITATTSSSSTLAPSLTGALLADGTVMLNGNLTVAPGKLIDGWDIDVALSYLYTQVATTEDFAYSGLGLSNTDDGATYTLILTSSSYPGAAASILASDASGRLGVQNLGLGIAAQTGYALYSSVSSPSYIANDLRIGTTAAGALSSRLHVLTTGTQAQFSYDTSNYGFVGVGSAGTLTLGNTGTTAANAHIYLNPGGGSAKVGIGNSIPTPTAKLEVNSTTEQLRLNYSGSFYTAFTVSSAGHLTIDPTGGSGRVGIGNSIPTPTAKLEVNSITEQLRLNYSGSFYASHTVSSAGNYTIAANGSNIYTPNHLLHPSYASQLTAWRISNLGEADFRYLYTDELHAKAFIADLEQALAGGQIISKSVAKVYANFTVPTAGNTGNLDVEEFAGFAAFHVFVDGDLVRLRQFDRSGGGLKIADVWGTVVYSAQVSSSNPPAQRYIFTRHATYPGTGSGTISAGTLVLDYGTTGNGYYEVNAIDGAAGVNSPYTQIVTWATHPKSVTANQGLQLRVRMGQLRGLTGVSQFGLYAGTGWTANPNEGNVAPYTVTTPTVNDAHRYILAGDNGVDIYNANLQVYSGTTPVITLDRTGPDLSIGSGSDTMTYTSGASGFWVGNDSGTYKMRLGSVSGGALTSGLSWDGSLLRVMGSAYIGNGVGFSVAALLYCPFDTPQGSSVPNLNGHLGQVATSSGPVTGIYTGRYNGALYLEDGVTNLLTNNSFETNITGITANGATITQSSAQAYIGSKSLRGQSAASGQGWYYNVAGVTSVSTTYTWSVYVRGTGNVRLFFFGSSGYAQTVNVTLTSTWTRYSTTHTWAAGDTTRLVGVEQNGAGSADWYTDATQLEQRGYPTTYAATSRTVSIVRYDASANLNVTDCTLSGWFYIAAMTGRTATFFGGDNTGSLTVYATATAVNVSRKDSSLVATVATVVPANTWTHIAVTVSGGTVTKLYINGALAASGTAGSAYATPSYLMIGSYNTSGGNNINGYIDDVASIGRVLSADEIASIYNSNAPLNVIRNNYELMLANASTSGYVVGNASGLYGYSDTTGSAGTGAFALVTTASTALSAAFGSVTLDAGDMMIGSASTGYSNLYWDQSAGALALRNGTTSRMTLNSSGNLVITNGVGTSMLTLNGSEALARLTGILFVDSNGEVRTGSGTVGGGTFTGIRIMNYGAATVMGGYYNDALQWDIGTAGQLRFGVVAGNPSLTLDSSGIKLTTPTSYAAINALKWEYSGTYTGIVYSLVTTGSLTSTLHLQSQPYSGGSIGAVDVNAFSSSGYSAARFFLVGTPNSATAGPYARIEFRNTSNTLLGGTFSFQSTAATSATMTGAGFVRYRMHYRLVVRASGGNATTLTGDLGVNASTTATVGGTANDFRVGVHTTGYVYWDRVAGTETYDVQFWAICT